MEKINQIPQVFFTDFIAHVHKDGSKQSVEIHLSEVAVICALLAAKINRSLAGELIGLSTTLVNTVETFKNIFSLLLVYSMLIEIEINC